MNNIERFWKEINQLREHKKKRQELDYMGDGGLAPLTNRQRACIFGILKNLNADPSDYGIESVSDLTLAEAAEHIDQLVADQDMQKSSRGYNRDLF